MPFCLPDSISCYNGDSISCYTLAAMLLRGDQVNKTADNVSPQEARGEVPLVQRENEEGRARLEEDAYVIPRNSKRAEELLTQACETGAHVTSCDNLAVMYMRGDDGVPQLTERKQRTSRRRRKTRSISLEAFRVRK